MSDIKIFVSHRIDLDSETIDNPLYVNVRCGAVYDKRKNVTMLGDDTGDNISEKRSTFCELTVQYWAWKNRSADYYGLCHYRRYLSFSERQFRTNVQNVVIEPLLLSSTIERYHLMDVDRMQRLVRDNDIIVSESADVRGIPTPKGSSFPSSVRELWEGHDGVFIHKEDLDILLQTIQKLHPEYSEAAKDYMNDIWHRGYNCYIMRQDLFFKMCEFQFPILAEMEKQINISAYEGNMKRMCGYMGEILYGIFIHFLELKGTYRIHALQLVYFEETRKPHNFVHKIWLIFLAMMTFYFRHCSEVFLPIGSPLRERVKTFLKCLRGFNS